MYEGPALEPLLEKVSTESGASARIVAAEKVRKGGVLGFFAREVFRVSVEPGEADSSGWPNEAAALQAAQEAAPSEAAPELADPFALLAELPDLNEISRPFEEVLREVSADLGPETGPPDVGPGPPERTVEELEPPEQARHPVVAEPRPPAPLHAEIEEFLATHPQPLVPSASGGNHAADLSSALGSAGLGPEDVEEIVFRVEHGIVAEAALVEVLGRLPKAPPLPHLSGSLIVIAGAGPRAHSLASGLAAQVGSDPSETAIATPSPAIARRVPSGLSLRGSEEAAERAPGWRRSRVAMVALDAALDGDLTWARHVLAALRPTAVWGLVDAWAKPDDIRSWAVRLGGIDALAVENVGATSSPATSLLAGIPVALLDGAPASAARWAALVADAAGRVADRSAPKGSAVRCE